MAIGSLRPVDDHGDVAIDVFTGATARRSRRGYRQMPRAIDSPQTSLRVRLRNQLSDLSILNEVLDRFGQRGALPQATLSELRIVCDEIIGNVIAYAYPHGGEHEIDVRLQMIA